MDSATWKQAFEVYDTYGDLSFNEFKTRIDNLSLDREVKEMLINLKKDEEDASDYFDDLSGQVTGIIEPPIPKKLGSWSIIKLIDTGGMSSVYLAERDDEQFQMKAAAKLIHYAGYNPVVLKRFKREMQFLALLNHPNITRIIDSGVSEHGVPWYIMEYVEGMPITTYCNEKKLSTEERIRLFLQVCDAVQHAHKNLVIHRDLKPSNILVDTDGNVKLLDFGIAKALSGDDEASSRLMLTRDNQMLMTPEYASPEQLDGTQLSTASDVYSLGIILYQILTGSRPHTFDTKSAVQMVNHIYQVPPAKPTTLAKESDTMPPGIEKGQLGKELDDILLAALRIEPDRRYASAEQLGRDLKNYLNNEPVLARADSKKYRLQKFIQRNKKVVGLSVLSVVILLTSMAAILWQSRVIAMERDIAQTEATLSNAVRDHLMFLFREAGSLSDDTGQVSARELFDRTAVVAGEWLQDSPEIQRQVYAVIGEIMLALNDYSAAEDLLEKVVKNETDEDSPFLRAIIYRDLAQVHHRQGNLEEGFNLIDEAAGIMEAAPGDHRVRLSDILQIRGRLHRDLGRRDEAIEDLERARALARESSAAPLPLLARAESNLGTTLLMTGDLHAATPYFEQAMEIWNELGRPESAEALNVQNNLAVSYNHIGQPEKAKSLFRQVVNARMHNYGESGSLASSMLHLGRILILYGELEEAEDLIRRSEDMAIRFVGESSPSHAAANIGLGELYRAKGRYDQALSHYETAHSMFSSLLGPSHPFTLLSEGEILHTSGMHNGSADHTKYKELIEKTEVVGPGAHLVLSGFECQAVKNAVALSDYDLAAYHSARCRQLRAELGLLGWREIEANALAELTAALQGLPGSLQNLQSYIDDFGKIVSEHHPGLQWIQEQATLLDGGG